MRKLELHWQILIGMLLGILFGFAMTQVTWGKDFVSDWIQPLGTIFVKLLKLIAIPLILASLVKGISDLKDISKFKNIGLRTIGTYIVTTVVAITIGLLLVNVLQPGNGISEETVTKLTDTYAGDVGVTSKLEEASRQKESGPLQFLIDMVPDNAFSALSDNGLMLQVIFFAIMLAIAMLLIGEKKAKPLKDFFDSLNDVVLKMVDLIMLTAPYAVFALLAGVVVSSSDPDLLLALLKYAGVVVLGLVLMIVFYSIIVSAYTKKNPFWFLKEISPAQLLAFSTSSSAATLPVTMERVEEHIGVDKEVSSFVLPVGATINMDGTSLYQGVAAVFISQALGFDLTFSGQLTIILTALLASIGSAAVPGAGMVMLVIVLESIGFPADKLAIGLALIFAVDRPLDMCRTVVNVTGDATVSMIVAKSVGKLGEPHVEEWDDHLDELK
ncbi:dicarboxylate/amino acid:cation symporter [Muricauda sp. CAU 1633]|uniref:dicarboxylate/amino acid:cation symporter n=1 Tax=Allomuricauda sp. CAU 1633 TaxID=2816036 RepID=UPI001A8E977F|nr:dicarboxylate/amino acid:cation symporter [Muricauda sp. CAU 1633]MBO0323136.1 dicarboxylate/amino acid:cation symporter [Muricauda sp. CAU 1633]